ncbi:hypothetical protein D3C71_1705470 [compost metagenome]
MDAVGPFLRPILGIEGLRKFVQMNYDGHSFPLDAVICLTKPSKLIDHEAFRQGTLFGEMHFLKDLRESLNIFTTYSIQITGTDDIHKSLSQYPSAPFIGSLVDRLFVTEPSFTSLHVSERSLQSLDNIIGSRVDFLKR